MNVKQHPLMEVIARKLSGIESVPRKAQARMVLAACRAARKWHEAEIERRNNDLPHLHAPDATRKGRKMKRTNDPEVDRLIHGIKATETLIDNMRVLVHDGDAHLGEFDIACCLQHRGPSFRELSDRIRFGWSPPNDLPHLEHNRKE